MIDEPGEDDRTMIDLDASNRSSVVSCGCTRIVDAAALLATEGQDR